MHTEHEHANLWWNLGAGAAVVGAAGVGWSLAQVAGAAAASGAVLLGAGAIRWAFVQRAGEIDAPELEPADPDGATHAPWATPKLSGFYKTDPTKSDTRIAIGEGGTKSGVYPLNRATRSRTGTDL